MNRKLVLIVLLSALVIIGGTSLYLILGTKKKITTDALRAIPIDASIVVKVNSLEQLTNELHQKNEFWMAIENFKLVADVNKFFGFTKSTRNRYAAYDHLIYGNPVFFSAHTIGKGTPALFFAANIPEKVKPSDIQNFISEVTSNDFDLAVREYNGVKIYSYSSKKSDYNNEFTFAIYQGVAMYSQSQLLIESAIGQLDSRISLLDSKTFSEILKTAGTRVVANVFVNHNRLPNLLSLQVHPSQRTGLQNLAHVANWSELDLSIKDNAFYLNGFAQVPDTLNVLYKIFTRQKPVKMKVPEVLPAQTAALVFLGISDINQYFTSYRKFLEVRGRAIGYNQRLDREGRAIGADLTKLYTSIFGSELALAFIPFEGESYGNCWFIAAEVKSQSFARQELMGIIESYASRSGQSVSSFERTFVVDREKSVKIYRFPKSGLHETLFGSLFAVATDQYFTFIDNYIVFGSSVEALSRLILANIHNKQLVAEQSFLEFSQSLSSESNFTAYINPAKAEMLYGHKLDPSAAARIISRIETVGKVQGLAIQLTGGRSMIFNNICARYSPIAFDAPQTVWETRLDTTFTMKPQLVINHNTQEREIFIQDSRNNIYLINHVGRVLWKRPLPEKIMGEAEQIDLFRNGKLQIVFNTKSSLYVIDRNGNNVDGFPAKLRSPATNPVAVFDYENNRDYRFFVAGEDRKVYVYNRNGNLVTGFDFDRTEREVRQPIQHFRVGGRDYIVLADNNRPYILDRRGNERVKPSRAFTKAPNSTIVLEDNQRRGPARFATTDTLGIVRFIYLDGRVEERVLKRMSRNHFFDYQDVDGDGNRDFIYLDGNELTVVKHDGKELFSKKFKHDMQPQVIYFQFGARDRKLGVVCTVSSQIYLINSDGSFYKGFPLKGITPFSIGRFASTKSTFNLIVGSSSGFVLNYAVQ